MSPRTTPRAGRRGLATSVSGALCAALLAALLAGCGTAASETPTAPAPAAPTSVAPSAPVAVDAAAPLSSSTPERVTVPAIGVDSSLVPLGLNPDKTVEVPPLAHSEQAGWYRYRSTPGAVGPAVILGHIDGGGKKGVFYRLQDMKPGQQITVSRADGRNAVFTVTEVHNYPKTDFPTDRVYGKTSDAELRLISCGGALDRAAHSYDDNVVVFATLTGTSRT